MHYSYPREKLTSAIHILATGQGDVRSRLLHAYDEFHPLRENHFPEPLKKKWAKLYKGLTRFGPVHDHKGQIDVGSVQNTLQRIKNSTGEQLANLVFDLYSELAFNSKYQS